MLQDIILLLIYSINMLQNIVLLWICNYLAAPQWCITVSWIGIVIHAIAIWYVVN